VEMYPVVRYTIRKVTPRPGTLMEAHVAPAWPGNGVAVVVRHYLQVTEDHFKQATEKSDAESGATRTPTPGHDI